MPESLFTEAVRMMETMGGMHRRPNIDPPSEAEISAVINRVFGSEPIPTAIQNMLSSLQDSTTPVTSIDHIKLVYIKSGDILVSTNDENLSLLCEGSKLRLNCNDVVRITGVGNFEVLSVGSNIVAINTPPDQLKYSTLTPHEASDRSSLDDLLIMATDMLEDFRRRCDRINAPTCMTERDMLAMQSAISAMDPPSTQEAIREMFNSLQGCQDFEEAARRSTALIDSMKLVYIRSGDILVSVNDENLSLLCEGHALKCNDIIQITGLGNLEVLSVGSDSEKWVLREF